METPLLKGGPAPFVEVCVLAAVSCLLNRRSASNPPSKALIYSALLCVAVINCGYNVLTKYVLSGASATTKADPLLLSLLRDAIAYPILQFGALISDGFRLPRMKDLPLICLLGLLGMFGNQFLFMYGMEGNHVTATEASILSQTQPVFAAVLAMFAGQVQPSRWVFLGVLLTFGGSMIMAKAWNIHKLAGDDGLHIGSILLGALAMALYYVVQKPMLESYPPLSLTAWAYFFGTLWMGMASLSYLTLPEDELEAKWASVNTGATRVALAFAVIMNSVLKYALQSFANKWTGATITSCWMCVVPVLTALVGTLIGERPCLSYLGGCPVLAGVYLVTAMREPACKAIAPAAEKEPPSPPSGGYAAMISIPSAAFAPCETRP